MTPTRASVGGACPPACRPLPLCRARRRLRYACRIPSPRRRAGRAAPAGQMIAEVHRRWAGCVRIHVSGDFNSAEYVRKWVAIARACPTTRFYAYTRSWRRAGRLGIAAGPALRPLGSTQGLQLLSPPGRFLLVPGGFV